MDSWLYQTYLRLYKVMLGYLVLQATKIDTKIVILMGFIFKK